MWVTVSLVAVYVGLYLFIVFVSLSLACGLYYLAELIEEYTLTTRRILTWAIRVSSEGRPGTAWVSGGGLDGARGGV
jgi:hypothetical protein